MTRPDPTPQTILAAVCAFHRVSPRQINDQTRTQSIQWVRHQLIFLLREMTDLSLAQIGVLVGGRDAKTVVNAIQRVTNRISSDAEFASDCERLKAFVLSYDPQPRGAAAVGRARRLLSAAALVESREVNELAMTLLIVSSILGSPDLSDAEARIAALSSLGMEPEHA